MTMPVPGAWSYDAELTQDKDIVRFYLQDCDPNVRLLADSEIAFLIDAWAETYNGSLIYVAHKAAQIVAAKFAGVVTVDADGVAVDLSKLSAAYGALALQLVAMYHDEQIGAEVDITNLLWCHGVDPRLAPMRFGIGDMDNPEAGQQDYGGMSYNTGWWDMFDHVPGV